jgi:hypothetical protein
MMMTSNTTQGTSTTQAITGYVPTFADSNVPSVHEAVTGSTTEKIMIFTTADVNHTFTVPADGLNCDILMIGGGGSGGQISGGGGAGACIVAINQILPAGTYNIFVGGGAITKSNNSGSPSYIYNTTTTTSLYLARGGGVGAYNKDNGVSGGCGGGGGAGFGSTRTGGAASTTNIVNGSINIGPSVTSTYVVYGTKGGDQLDTASGDIGDTCAGGGGIGAVGVDHQIGAINGGAGGSGRSTAVIYTTPTATTLNLRSYFANNGNNFGVLNSSDGQYYIGGGGGGTTWSSTGTDINVNIGGIGGGGRGWAQNKASATNGAANTGSGGGGGAFYASGFGGGGSGIIIIRYRSSSTTTYTHTPTSTTTLSTTLGTPSIELVRGTQGDSNTDYKIGNYSGDFIVKSSVSGVDSDYIRMLGTNGAIYNFTNSLYWTQTSDRRIKENIMRASYDMCYDNIDKLELNRFNYIKEFNTGNKDTNQLGFIAQEIKEIFPKAVFTNNYSGADLNIQDMLSIDIGQINYTLYGAVKKLMEINKDKEARLKRLEGLLNIEDGSGSSGNLLDTSNIAIDTSNLLDTSNITIDTSNIAIDTSNIAIDTSNILEVSNIAIDTSNIAIDSSNIVIESSNVVIDITPDDILSSNMNI